MATRERLAVRLIDLHEYLIDDARHDSHRRYLTRMRGKGAVGINPGGHTTREQGYLARTLVGIAVGKLHKRGDDPELRLVLNGVLLVLRALDGRAALEHVEPRRPGSNPAMRCVRCRMLIAWQGLTIDGIRACVDCYLDGRLHLHTENANHPPPGYL